MTREIIWDEWLDKWAEVEIHTLGTQYMAANHARSMLDSIRAALRLRLGEYYFVHYEKPLHGEDLIRFRFNRAASEIRSPPDATRTEERIQEAAERFKPYGFVKAVYHETLRGLPGQGEHGHLHPVHLMKWTSHIPMEMGRFMDRDELIYFIHVLVENQFYRRDQETDLYKEIVRRRGAEGANEKRALGRVIGAVVDFAGDADA